MPYRLSFTVKHAAIESNSIFEDEPAEVAALLVQQMCRRDEIIGQDELDLTPPGGPSQQPATGTLASTLDQHVAKARESLRSTTDEFLLTTNWRLKAGGQVVMNQPRHVVLRDTLNHLAHHRGQLTVYLRLLDQPVPAIYGPSADDQQFA